MSPGQIYFGAEQAARLTEVLRDCYVGGNVVLTQQGDGSLIFADEQQTFEITTVGNVFEV